MVVLVIAGGEFLTVMGEIDRFDLLGFLLCLSASVLSGARWTLVQLKLQTLDPPLKTTITTMKLLAPTMFLSMLFLSIVIEKPWEKFHNIATNSTDVDPYGNATNVTLLGADNAGDEDSGATMGTTLHILLLGMIGAFFAIAMILCEFHLIMYASAIILMIGGVIKEMITIFVGVTFFHDELNKVNLAGCFVVFSGVVMYKVAFHLDKTKGSSEDDDSKHHGRRAPYQPVENTGDDMDDDALTDTIIPTPLDGEVRGLSPLTDGVELRRVSETGGLVNRNNSGNGRGMGLAVDEKGVLT